MKKESGKLLLMLCMTLLCSLLLSMTALAAETEGALTAVDGTHIAGWAWNMGSYDETVTVELRIYADGASDPAKVITVPANSYSEDVSKSIGDGYHAFTSPVDWSALNGTAYRVEAYAVSGEEKQLLSEAMEYKADPLALVKTESAGDEIGPGIPKKEEPEEKSEEAGTAKYKKGESLGIFTTTGYCGCSKCSGGNGLTYSGTVPTPGHTISADLSVLPLGTKVMIGDTVYTVEDIGSGVDGHKVDIFFGSHQEALDHGVRKQEVFRVIEE